MKGSARMSKFFKKFICLMVIFVFAMPAAVVMAEDKPEGSGSVEDPYKISTLSELYWFVDLVNKSSSTAEVKTTTQNAVLTADITVNSGKMTASTNADRVLHWKPINDFNATFDGQGHTISGIYYDDDDSTTSTS